MNAPTATAFTQPGFAALKTCQQGTYLSEDYALTGMPSRIVGEAPCETLQVRAGREQTAAEVQSETLEIAITRH